MDRVVVRPLAVVLASGILSFGGPVPAQCPVGWTPRLFGWSDLNRNAFSGGVDALAVVPEGSGDAVYAAGLITAAGDVPCDGLVRYDGRVFDAVPTGLTSPQSITALATFDDGSGPGLHVFGSFASIGGIATNNMARWNGTGWSAMGPGLTPVATGNPTWAHAVYDDGSGSGLYVGGRFTITNPAPPVLLARWRNGVWQPIGGLPLPAGSVTPFVTALAAINVGLGPELWVAVNHGTSPLTYSGTTMLRWNGAGWASAGTIPTTIVRSLRAFRTGQATQVFAACQPNGGWGLQRWSGGTIWTPATSLCGSVAALEVCDLGNGPSLYAAGACGTGWLPPYTPVYRFDGVNWSAAGGGFDTASVRALAFWRGPSGAELLAGGSFIAAGNASIRHLARWDGTTWRPPVGGVSIPGAMLGVVDMGTGPALYAGGGFASVGNPAIINHLARWGGGGWAPLGSGPPGAACAVAGFDEGSGPRLFLGGPFSGTGAGAMNGVARWNGTSWSALGTGVNGSVCALAVFDDGSGPALHVGGSFTSAGGVPALNVARWNGTTWTPSGAGLGYGGPGGAVNALKVVDLGSGPQLYAAGWFAPTGTTGVGSVARWTGTAWAPIGAPMPTTVWSLAAFDDGTGMALYAGAPGAVLRWNGTTWLPVGGLSTQDARALQVFDDGTGPALYVSGGGLNGLNILRWNGISWQSVGGGLTSMGASPVSAFAVFDDGSGSALFVAAQFFAAGGNLAGGIARWGPQAPRILRQPVHRSAVTGTPVSFTVSASGATPVSYQWRFGGVLIAGATSPVLAAPAVASGLVDVVVSNACGSVVSAPAALTAGPVLLRLLEPHGAGSVRFEVGSVFPLMVQFTAVSIDLLNRTSPGTGSWSGLHITVPGLWTQALSLQAPFITYLDASGGSTFTLAPGSVPPVLAGSTMWAVTLVLDLATLAPLGVSPIASLGLR